MSHPGTSWAADLHLHSRYSRATAADLTPANLAFWAARKGLAVVGTGDLTHPAWREELRQALLPDDTGLYRLAEAQGAAAEVRFVPSGEVSCIFKQAGATRKVHLVILLPDLAAAERLGERLTRLKVNLTSDGRPIMGLKAKDVVALALEASPWAEVVPAHIWTPWFSALGSKSGFDSLAECFEDLTPHIHAAETGLSSDPAMNWRVSSLDGVHLLSSSDAHSAAKLGREATLFDCPPSYERLLTALRTGAGLAGTLEFFPEEGKYHLDGHRKCHVRLDPAETARLGGRCPACGGPVTVGVLSRVQELADRAEGVRPASARPFESLLSLDEVLGQALGVGPGSKKVGLVYEELLSRLGPELFILRQVPLEEIGRVAGPVAAEGVRRVRAGLVQALAGYDGEFGTLTLFTAAERAELTRQGALFFLDRAETTRTRVEVLNRPAPATGPGPAPAAGVSLDEDQAAAAAAPAGPILVLAGPGGGKTRVLQARVEHLLGHGADPARLAALTFTRRAAGELKDRLAAGAKGVVTATFHALGLDLLGRWGLGRPVLDEESRLAVVTPLAKAAGLRPAEAAEALARAKLGRPAGCPPDLLAAYQTALTVEGVYDYEDLLAQPLALAEANPDLAGDLAGRFDHLLVDEFQDLNQAQFDLLGRLAPEPDRSVFVVGDPDQSIYGFRGGSPAFFQALAQARPGLATRELATAHRCQAGLLAAAQAVIAANPGRHLTLRPARPAGEKIRLAALASPAAEAVFVIQEIEALLGGSSHLAQARGGLDGRSGLGLAEIAVLYRLHRQAGELAEALDQAGLPFQMAGEEPARETDGLDLQADKITLLTCHAAKGLEFPAVFVVGLEEGLFPFAPPQGRLDVAEERRLLYVALTRAKDRLCLTKANQRVLYGQAAQPGWSPLIQAIPRRLVAEVQTRRFRRTQVQMDLF